MKRKNEAQRKRDTAFRDMVREWLESLGCRYSSDGGDYRYNYVLETKFGTLHITPQPGWVACRFDEAATKAAAVVGCCSRVGKMNYHPYPIRNKGEVTSTFRAFQFWLGNVKPELCEVQP